MKRFALFLLIVISASTFVNAQILSTDSLEKYAKEQYGEKWEEAAITIGRQIKLDKNKALTYVKVIDAPGKTAQQLYVALNMWITSTFNDVNSKILLNDKELGTIIVQGYAGNIAQQTGIGHSYEICISPTIKADIKEGKIRVTYTVPSYHVMRTVGGGWLASMGSKGYQPKVKNEQWGIDSCFPFVEKDKHKNTSCKALVMTYAYSNVVIDKLEECIKQNAVSNSDKDW